MDGPPRDYYEGVLSADQQEIFERAFDRIESDPWPDYENDTEGWSIFSVRYIQNSTGRTEQIVAYQDADCWVEYVVDIDDSPVGKVRVTEMNLRG